MFNHILNDVIHFWLQYPESTLEDTVLYVVSNDAQTPLDTLSTDLVSYLEEQREIFSNRVTSVKNWDEDSIMDSREYGQNTPIGANPFMDDYE